MKNTQNYGRGKNFWPSTVEEVGRAIVYPALQGLCSRDTAGGNSSRKEFTGDR